eukprot:CCRYP_018825-RA/>CCRYP_018825-RA protein AED:0.16 eAED:0.16 QI:155/0.75/0.6/1/0.5/0.4/5/343/531
MPRRPTPIPSLLLLLLHSTSAQPPDPLSCVNCVGNGKKCIGDPSVQAINDEDCVLCLKSSSKWTWPCNVEGLCWCWDTSKPKFKPTVPSGLEVSTKKPCEVFTKKMFDEIAPNAVEPYTYEGLCDTIDMLNERYDEKLFQMGSVDQQKNEWAAFVGHTTHESAQYTAAREALFAHGRWSWGSGTYCKPCANENFDWADRYCEVSLVSNGQMYEEYCDKTVTPPFGCVCGPTTEVESNGNLAGLMNPNFVYFGRGALQLSWNANYLKASQVLAESADTLCSQPELVATDPTYAWGTALWFWNFNRPPGDETTCHIQSLTGSFGGSLNIINGGLECPAHPNSYHADAIVTRLRYYCIAATVIGVKRLLSFDGCDGLAQKFEDCNLSGMCPECNEWMMLAEVDSDMPTKMPSPLLPTQRPTIWRSWANEDWMSEIKRRDSSAVGLSNFLGLLTCLVTSYVLLGSNGGLECPAHPNNYHADAIVTRLPFPWFTATVTGVKGLLSFDRCDGLAQKFEDCNLSGICALAEVDSDMPT